jgi:hypothetical protein
MRTHQGGGVFGVVELWRQVHGSECTKKAPEGAFVYSHSILTQEKTLYKTTTCGC